MDTKTIMAIQDIPLGESGAEDHVDQLGVKPYVEALQAFILSCGTPMTVAIQGDWGTGKTSMMRQIERDIQDNVHTIWFNTWQYSQFSQTDTLPFTFLSAIADRIATKGLSSSIKDKVSNIAKICAPKLLGAAFKFSANAVTGGAYGDITDAIAEGIEAKADSKNGAKTKAESINIVRLLEKLKDDFSQACAEKCKETGKSRIVIFVDDLDRIQPARAVELLETLKMFLDVGKCVFVLALDYAVVKRGLGEKFGVSEKDLDGRSFFDKIIQLPFTMPTGSYKLEKYLDDLLSKVGFTTHKQDIHKYMDLLQNSIGANPRSIKRLVNVVTLMNIVFSKQKEANKETDLQKKDIEDAASLELLLFAFVCLQTAYEQVYSYLRMKFNSSTLKKLCSSKEYADESSEIYKTASTLPGFPSNRDRLMQFMSAFYSVVDKDRNGEIDEKEMQDMRLMMFNLSITAVESQQVQFSLGTTVKDDIISQTCSAAMNDFSSCSNFEVSYSDDYAMTDGSIKNRSYNFNDGIQCIQIYLSGVKSGSDFKTLEHEVTIAIYLDEDSFDGKPKKVRMEKCAQFLSMLKKQGIKGWDCYSEEQSLEAGIKFTFDNVCPGPELAKLISDKLCSGYELFHTVVEQWDKKNTSA